MTTPTSREEMADEINARLEVRRKFYAGAFVVFVIAEFGIMLFTAWMNPQASVYIFVGAASAILGTGAVMWWAYGMRKLGLYANAGEALLRKE
jgi:hypothetical protein